MTWEILAALITIVGCLVAVGGVFAKLITTLTKLSVSVDNLARSQEAQKVDAEREHEHLNDKINRNRERIDDHETRIHDLERGD